VKVLIAILLILFVLLQYKLLLGEGGFTEVSRLEGRVEEKTTENQELQQRNNELQAEVEDLRERLGAVEERARNELGLIKQDEEFYQVVPVRPAQEREGG
jgi:cell division protein FtsB